MLLAIDDADGNEIASSDDGSVMVQQQAGMKVTLHAQNLNRNKTLKVRLRSEAGL
jgi:hypothetical protein